MNKVFTSDSLSSQRAFTWQAATKDFFSLFLTFRLSSHSVRLSSQSVRLSFQPIRLSSQTCRLLILKRVTRSFSKPRLVPVTMNSPGDNRSPVRKTKRLSISNINPELDTHMANLQITQKPTFTQQLASRIRETAYSNSSSGPATQNMGHFTIQMDDHFRTSTTSQDPDVVYKEAMRCYW
jgi:hypothetical protein